MKRKLMALLIGASFAAASGLATARDHVSVGFYVGPPAYTYAAPAYYAPPPVYYPAPAYYYGPAYYRYGPHGVRYYSGHHRGWQRRHWRR